MRFWYAFKHSGPHFVEIFLAARILWMMWPALSREIPSFQLWLSCNPIVLKNHNVHTIGFILCACGRWLSWPRFIWDLKTISPNQWYSDFHSRVRRGAIPQGYLLFAIKFGRCFTLHRRKSPWPSVFRFYQTPLSLCVTSAKENKIYCISLWFPYIFS